MSEIGNAETLMPKPTEKQLATRFQPGQSGNPAGSRAKFRNKLSNAFVKALSSDFETHGAKVIATVRERYPCQYLKLVASLLPSRMFDEPEVVVGEVVFHGINDDESLLREAKRRGFLPEDWTPPREALLPPAPES